MPLGVHEYAPKIIVPSAAAVRALIEETAVRGGKISKSAPEGINAPFYGVHKGSTVHKTKDGGSAAAPTTSAGKRAKVPW